MDLFVIDLLGNGARVTVTTLTGLEEPSCYETEDRSVHRNR